MHPLVELFTDDKLEAYWSEAEEAIVPLPPLIGRLQTMKDGWGDQGGTEPPTTTDRATARERFSTSYIARNPLKLPEIVLDENFLFMTMSPPEVVTVGIHMDPESLDTSFGGLTASAFQGVATLITLAGPFKMEGARWHLLSNVFSSPEDIKTDLYRERLLQETMDKHTNCRSFAWKVLRQAKLAVGAMTYIGDTALTAPPFFDNVVRGNSTVWGFETLGLRVINWTGLSRHEGEIGGFCKVSRDEEGSFSNRAEHAAACIALEDMIAYAGSKRPLILLTDSNCLLMAIQRCIKEGINPSINESPGGDILREILELLRARIDLYLFTLFVKIKSHRGEFLTK